MTTGPLPALPEERVKRSRWLLLSFLLCVVLPTAIVGAYFTFFAADQYVAEFRFAVTETAPMLPSMGGTSGNLSSSSGSSNAMSSMGAMAGLGGSIGGSMQNFVVVDYLLSRQVVDQLQERLNIIGMYSGPSVGSDFWAGFDSALPIEKFVRFWDRMVSASYDMMTGLATVKVRAFTPQDALLIANTMVVLAEDLVNTIAKRPQLDAIKFSEGAVQRAEERLNRARAVVTAYRYREGVVDPSGSIANNVELIKTLRGQLIQSQADLAALEGQQQNTNAPMAQALRSRIAATKEQLAKVEREVGQDAEGKRILADIVGRYEELDLERQYAQNLLVVTMQALDQARANAAAQHLYLTPYVRPALPQSATYPKRVQSTLLVGLGLFGLWMVGVMIIRSIREHL